MLALALAAALAAGQTHTVPVHDQWFPGNAAQLTRVLDQSFAVAAQRSGGAPPRKNLLGLVVPHAALVYSGAVAAAAYSRLDKPANVIILGFSHRVAVRGVVAPAIASYTTPLGELRVQDIGFDRVAEARVCDHSVENQLPFIQRAVPKATVTPLIVGEMTEQELAAAARKLAGRLKRGDVIVASSDFTHYGAAHGYTPFANDAELPAWLRDRFIEAIENIGTLHVPEFDGYLAATGDTICGRGPIRLLMAALARWNEDVFMSAQDYMTSGDMTRDWSMSVSYGALAFYPFSAYKIGPGAQKRLLASARATLDRYLAAGKPEPEQAPPDPELDQRAGVFVTIKKNGALRGCLGDIAARRPIRIAVPERTLASASQDTRFKPLTAEEGPVTIEISLLTPVKKVAGWKDVKLGQGVILDLNGRRATFLPQIASEAGWNRTQLLEELSKKAGLARQSYKERRANLYVYSAHVFGELQ